MNESELSSLGVPELVDAYRRSASRHGEATECGNHKQANIEGERIGKIYAELRRRGVDAQQSILDLLSDQAPGVRLWSASHALEFAASRGEPILQELVPYGRFLGLSAEMTLKEWRAGRLRFP